MKKIIFLDTNDILFLYNRIITEYGGLKGIRDLKLLDSAMVQPQLLYHYKKSDIYELAAAYCFSIIKNHPFVDGNKSTGLLAALVFLEKNGKANEYDLDSLYELAIGIADSSFNLDDITYYFKTSSLNKN